VTGATCSNYRELISSRIDGELDPADETAVDAHLLTCAACQAYQDDAFSFRRSLRMRAVEPDEAPATAAPVERSSSLHGVSLRGVEFLRYALLVIGGVLVVLNLSSIVTADSGVSAHLSRHDGIFGTALGIGMLAVAAKPQRAIGLVPLTSVVALLMVVVAGADLITGNANLLGEAVHIVEFAGLICLWVISGGPSRLPKYVQFVSKKLHVA